MAYDHQKHVRPSGANGLADPYLLGTLLYAVRNYGVDSYPGKRKVNNVIAPDGDEGRLRIALRKRPIG
jgi:hypothetical protein